jgi:translocator protein
VMLVAAIYRSLRLALEVGELIAALGVVLVAAIYRSLPVNRAAGLLLVPYLLWIVYASSLNAGIVALNP